MAAIVLTGVMIVGSLMPGAISSATTGTKTSNWGILARSIIAAAAGFAAAFFIFGHDAYLEGGRLHDVPDRDTKLILCYCLDGAFAAANLALAAIGGIAERAKLRKNNPGWRSRDSITMFG